MTILVKAVIVLQASRCRSHRVSHLRGIAGSPASTTMAISWSDSRCLAWLSLPEFVNEIFADFLMERPRRRFGKPPASGDVQRIMQCLLLESDCTVVVLPVPGQRTSIANVLLEMFPSLTVWNLDRLSFMKKVTI
ncbi:hypothetical protein CEXT_78661 [Caerostris extrusa]|uniref:Uncharacterized protein n=1 Tax=Caerostris extrusa TaxID=172846 RepID=A0AAV4SBF5_CAEEX|nr:hypothetical protein CEXT_78661 [Caerostris extrusa]